MLKQLQIFILIAFTTLALDQFTKLWIVEHPKLPIVIIPDYVQIIFFRNTGVAFSIPLPEFIIIPLVLLMIVIGGWYLHRELDLRKKLAVAALALIVAGALGNVIDRLRLGYVVDFISLWKFPVFNVADIAITGGIAILIFWYSRLERRR